MSNILKKICDNKIKEIEQSKSKCSFSTLEKLIKNKENRKFKNLLIESNKNKKNNIIAEIKKASPSAGILIKDYYPETIAVEYEKSGVGAISILTEKKFFYGDIDHISILNKSTNLPIIRKDFIIDEYQILESKVYKADAILLIASLLDDKKIKSFINLAKKFELDCLLEVHTEEELNRIIKIGYPIIGLNNRNLKNLSTNINNSIKLINKIPKDFVIVAESGIKEKNDIKLYNEFGIYNFLIGESILKSENFSDKINELIN